MAVYQGTPLPRTGARKSVPRQPAPRPPTVSGLPAARTTTSIRTRGRSATPMYGNTLPRGAMLARAAVPKDEPVRHVALLGVVAAPRPRVALAGVAVVLVLTFVGLFYLGQTFAAAAARYETEALLMERQAMLMELRSQQGATVRWGSEQQVTQWAQDTGLYRLGQPSRIRAR